MTFTIPRSKDYSDFDDDLKFSLDKRDEPFWEAIYRKAFPTMTKLDLCDDLKMQRIGIDRIVHLSSGDMVKIDQKLRRSVYPDVALEYISVDTEPIKKGWIEKDLAIDYLAYAFLPTQRCYMYPWLMLRRAWIGFGETWKKKYGCKKTVNKTYNTWWCPVPIEVLQDKVALAWIIQL